MALSLTVSAFFWTRRTRGNAQMTPVFLGAVMGALMGAKIGFLLAEGWMHFNHPNRLDIWLTGKTVLGALLGGYAGVELGKKVAGVRNATGDWFALAVPAGLIAGRAGCLFHGCCTGVACTWAPGGVWPAAWVEMAFNAMALAALAVLKRRGNHLGQLFHVYLIAYGLFRMLHEPLRSTPKLVGGISPYQVLALAVLVLGASRYLMRKRSTVEAQANPL